MLLRNAPGIGLSDGRLAELFQSVANVGFQLRRSRPIGLHLHHCLDHFGRLLRDLARRAMFRKLGDLARASSWAELPGPRRRNPPRPASPIRATPRQPSLVSPRWFVAACRVVARPNSWRPSSLKLRRTVSATQGWRASRSSGGAETGAGEGNRTLVFSLEGCCSTIELHPPCARRKRRWWER